MFGWLLGRKQEERHYVEHKGSDPFSDEYDRDYGAYSPKSVLEYDAVWQAVTALSGDLAGFPVTITGEDKNPEHALRTHRAYYALCCEPEPGVNANKWWRRVFTSWLLWNNAYAGIQWGENRRTVQNLWWFDPADVFYNVTSGMYEVNDTRFGYQRLFPSEILHFEGILHEPQRDTDNRLETWRQARRSFALGKVLEDYEQEFFGRGGHKAGILQIPTAMQKAGRQRLDEGWEKKRGSRQGWFRTTPLRAGATWQATGDSLNDSDLNELIDKQVARVARWFNLDPSKLGLPTNVSYGSLIEAKKAYYENTLAPWLRAVQGECWAKLCTETQKRAQSVYIVHDLEPLFSGDADAQTAEEGTPRQPRPNEEESSQAEEDTVME